MGGHQIAVTVAVIVNQRLVRKLCPHCRVIEPITDEERRAGHRSWPEEGAWIVGVDGSDCARTALAWVISNADRRTSTVHLVTAWQTPIYGPHSTGTGETRARSA